MSTTEAVAHIAHLPIGEIGAIGVLALVPAITLTLILIAMKHRDAAAEDQAPAHTRQCTWPKQGPEPRCDETRPRGAWHRPNA